MNRILSKIDIQNYLRLDQVIKSHQSSNLSKTCQKRVKSGCLIQLYALNICFDSEFGREFKFIRPRAQEFTNFENFIELSQNIRYTRWRKIGQFWTQSFTKRGRMNFDKFYSSLPSDDFLWPDLTSNNFEYQFPTKFRVETYVYLMYFDQQGRVDANWTDLTLV